MTYITLTISTLLTHWCLFVSGRKKSAVDHQYVAETGK